MHFYGRYYLRRGYIGMNNPLNDPVKYKIPQPLHFERIEVFQVLGLLIKLLPRNRSQFFV